MCEDAPMASVEVLVVEDAPEYAQIVTAVARENGYNVRTATTLADARTAVNAVPPDLVVLDLTLPDGDGLDLCRSLRETSDAYVLVLTGRDDEIDKVLGFKLGADDYLTKPFSPRELAVRMEALLRRTRSSTTASERTIGHLTIDPGAREVTAHGVPVELTRIEFDLLDVFTANPKTVFTRAQLIERVWGADWYTDDHTVDVHIANLRKKLDPTDGPSIFRTVRGIGYGLAGTVS